MLDLHYVYEHFDPETGAVFYVGMGTNGRAWDSSYQNRGDKHRARISTIINAGHARGSWVRIVHDGIKLRGKALSLERDLFHKHKLAGQPLCNKTALHGQKQWWR